MKTVGSTAEARQRSSRKRISSNGSGEKTSDALDREVLLSALQAVADGDFSVRLPGHWTGLDGKIADRFNDIVASNQQMARELARVGEVVGKQGKTQQRVRFRAQHRGVGRDAGIGQHADRRPGSSDDGGHARGHGGRAGQPAGDDAPRRRGPSARGRVPALRDDRQHDDQAARRVHVGSDAGRARSRHRRQARRPGAGARSQRRLEGPDRERQPDGEQPDRTGSQHFRRDDRRRERRPVAQDHGRRARRDPAAQGGHQHDGRPAALVRVRSDARRARGRHRRPSRRPGGGAGRRGHVEGPDRQRQPARGEPDDAGAQHRRGDDGRGARRPVAQDHGRCAAAKCSSSRTRSTRWSTSSTRSRRK